MRSVWLTVLFFIASCGPKGVTPVGPIDGEAASPLEAAVRDDPSDLDAALDLAEAYAAQGHHVFAVLLAEHVVLSSDDEAQRAAAAALARSTLAGNVNVSDRGVVTSLVPTRMASATMETLTDPRASWDRRYEVAAAVGAMTLRQETASTTDPFDVSKLQHVAQLRVEANLIALGQQQAKHTHPLVAFEASAPNATCALLFHINVLGYGSEDLAEWKSTHPSADADAKECAAGRSWRPPEGADLTRISWGVPW